MKTTIQLPEFNIVGIAVRTTNQHGKAAQDIGLLWQRFMMEQVAAQIPNKLSDAIYCVYLDYESDYQGEYTTLLGCRVTHANALPDFLIGKTIPTATYAVFESVGELPACVGRTWATIWQTPLQRAYLADFDVYDERASNPQNAVVETFVSVR